jgi:hypothetical protein
MSVAKRWTFGDLDVALVRDDDSLDGAERLREQRSQWLSDRHPALRCCPLQRDLQNLRRHPPQCVQGLMDVFAPAQIHLAHRCRLEGYGNIANSTP